VTPVFEAHACTTCHDATPGVAGGELDLLSDGLEERLVGRPSINSSCSQEIVVDPAVPEASLLLRVVDSDAYAPYNDPNCHPPPMPLGSSEPLPAKDVACIEDWIRAIDLEVEVDEAPFDPSSAYAALAKAKYLVHGGAITDEEISYAIDTSGHVDPEAMRELIDGWMWAGPEQLTDAFDAKLLDFLEVVLQQSGTGGSVNFALQAQLWLKPKYEFDQVDQSAYVSTIHDMFKVTARDIVQGSQDFREVVTTRRWRVTTAIMVALVYADHGDGAKPAPEDRLANFGHLEEADYHDWRYVNLRQATEAYPADFEYANEADLAASLRAIGDEGTLRLWAPRVGFFNTFPFFDEWESNVDNDFRVTLSQTLIGALDAIYETGDLTPPESTEALDESHSDPSTTCYNCNVLMDPARTIFARYYVVENVGLGPIQGTSSTFAFHDYAVSDIETMDDFAATLVEHPRFPVGWVQKVCMWANAQRCDESDPEVQRVAEVFAEGYDATTDTDDYRLDILFRELLSSPLVTATESTVTHQQTEYILSSTRLQHFCHAINQRVQDAADERCSADGLATESCDAHQESCGSFSEAEGLGADGYSRGIAELTTLNAPDPVYAIALRESCRTFAKKVSDSDGPFPHDAEDPSANVLRMVTGIMGLPPSHPRHDAAFDGLMYTYELLRAEGTCPDGQTVFEANEGVALGDDFVCGPGLTAKEAVRHTFTFACESPDFSTIGF